MNDTILTPDLYLTYTPSEGWRSSKALPAGVPDKVGLYFACDFVMSTYAHVGSDGLRFTEVDLKEEETA